MRIRSFCTALLLGILLFSIRAAAIEIDIKNYCNGSDDVDDTTCIGQWLQAGRASLASKLYASPGTYLYSGSGAIYSGLNLECAGTKRTVFKNVGGNGTLLAATANVKDVRIRRCGFDVNGNPTDFLAVISINPPVSEPSTNILLRHNRIYDSTIPGAISDQQRQYILLLNCQRCTIEYNRLSEGGRIKVGRPGKQLVIRKNSVSNANDNAITVVDIGSGVSQDIVVEENRILAPKGVGIFLGADGENETSASLTTRNVRVEANTIHGDWQTACILGTLPAIAEKIAIRKNTCTKTAVNAFSSAGISVRRTNGSPPRAKAIVVEDNKVTFAGAPSGTPALDVGGIVFTGNYIGVRVTNNEVRNVGPRAIRFRVADVQNAAVMSNTMVGGDLVIEGIVQGTVQQ